MGYEPAMAEQALKNNNGDIAKAIEELINAQGIIPVNGKCSLFHS